MPERPRTLRTTPAKPAPDPRPSACVRGYGAGWRKARAAFLREHPLCDECGRRGLVTEATEVDHVRALSKGGADDPSNYRPLCKRCHSTKTARVDGSFGRKPK